MERMENQLLPTKRGASRNNLCNSSECRLYFCIKNRYESRMHLSVCLKESVD